MKIILMSERLIVQDENYSETGVRVTVMGA